MNKRLLLAEKAFTIISLIHYSGGPLVLILTGGASEGDGSTGGSDFALIQLVFLVIYFINFCLLILRWKKVIQLVTKDISVWLLLGVAAFSFFWSYDPTITKSRVIALFGTILFSLYLASRYSLKEQLELLGWTFGIIIVTSFLLGIALPNYGKMEGVHWGKWRGIYSHKNVLGKVMTPSAIVFLLLAMKAQAKSWIFWGGLSSSVLLIILSKSSSALLNIIILISALLLFQILKWRSDFMLTALLGILSISIILYTLVTTNAATITALFGKDLTLSGRTNFWPLILDKIAQQPWLGYGFGAFWKGFDGPSDYIWHASSFKAPNSHNGYLDLCLELGLVGLSIYLIGYFISLQKALFYVRAVKTYDGFFPALFLVYIVLANLTESTLIIQNNFFLVIQFAIFFSISLPQKEPRKFTPEKYHKIKQIPII
ncbi:O-antigen ligase family protein [Merismopedia glauca]|uniref:Polymerase n=1 Tax=Merismopedia glauca CCAP 1448/3 TaxID=1296344 RepID=A0A2T1C1F8_9CYAN|nr:O-antigen ligase family protein [Merismopedia glauca]PSB02091.1 polymerase [Merismopedia glauca CCAP 1448/3]